VSSDQAIEFFRLPECMTQCPRQIMMLRAYASETHCRVSHKRGQRLRMLIATIVVLVTGVVLAHPPATTTEVLRVGWFQPGSGFLDYEDQYCAHQGLDPDILHRLALTHGLTLAYERFDSVPAALAALDEGRIDVIPAMFDDNVNNQRYWLSSTYSQQQIGIVKRSALPMPRTLSDLAKYRIASEEGGVTRRRLKQQLPQVPLINVYSPQEGIAAVSQGRADIYVGLQAVNRATIAQLGLGTVQSAELPAASVNLHFVTRRADRHSIAVVENGLSRLSQAQRADIEARWLKSLPELPAGPIATPGSVETSWLRKHEVLKIGIYSFREPYDFIDDSNQLRGVGSALLTAFAIRYHLRIQPIVLSAFSHPFDALENGRVDVIASAPIRNVEANTALVTPRYDTVPWLLIRRSDLQPAIPRIGAQLWRLPYLSPPPKLPANQLVPFDTSDDATDALLKGEVDAAFVNLVAANHLGTALKSGAIVIDRHYSSLEEIGFAVLPADAPLQYLLSQFLSAYPPDQLSEIIRRNHPATITIGFDLETAMRIIGPIILAIVILFVILSWANIRIRKASKIATRARIEADAARQQAELADQTKSTFLATMSHEIRTPMNGIVGVIDVLQTTPLSEFQQRYLDVAHQSTRLLLRVINDILDFSKIEAGRLIIEATAVDLYRASENIAGLYRALAQQKNISLYFAVMPHFDRYVLIDEVRLTQIVTNLISNAIRFTDSGYVYVRIRGILNGPGPVLQLQICDTGTGMSDAYLTHLFEPFIQEDGSTTRRYGGTGLGLSIVKRLVDLMHGVISVKSKLGHGTCVDIRLPFVWGNPSPPLPDYSDRHVGLAVRQTFLKPVIVAWLRRMHIKDAIDAVQPDCVVTDDASGTLVLRRDTKPDLPLLSLAALPRSLNEIMDIATVAPVSATASPDSVHPEISVMIVEDNDINRDIIQQQLHLLEIEVDTANDGEEALARWLISAPAVMLVDCQMPKMDGYELTRRIRAIEAKDHRTRTLIIAITANAGLEDERRCLEAGMDDFVPKPLTRQKLAAMLAKQKVTTDSTTSHATECTHATRSQ
jgi:signal transduction histidine kinase/FixJ family two-component response regulator